MNWFTIITTASSMAEALGLYKEARAPRDYKREYAQYHSKPQKVAERSQRNQARRIVGLKKGDPREVDHKNPISNGGSNARSNLRAVSLVENRTKFTKTASLWQRNSTTQGGEATYNVGFRPYGRAEVPHPKHKDKKIMLQFSRETTDKNPRELVQLLDKDSGESLAHTILLSHGKGLKEVKAMLTSENHRRQGLGREVMRYAMLKNPSDRFIAKPDPFADQKVSKEGLKKVYSSYGFQQSTNPDYMMTLSVEEQRKKLTKTASNHHHLITGHSGAGKSTLARKLSEETGAPIVALDDAPSIRAILQEQKDMARAHPDGKLNLTPELSKKYEAIELKAIQDAIAAKNPSIIEGSYFLKHDPEMFRGNKMMLVDRDRDTILNQRVERQRLKELGRGGEWSDERAAGVRTRGNQLLDYYQPGVDTWRNSSLVEKRATAVATKTDPAKWEAAKQEAKSKMGGKHSARAMQLATKIYKDNGGGYSGAKPTSSTNSLKKWTKQDWGYSGKDKPGPGGTGVYLPKQRRVALKSSEEGKRLLANAAQKKREATRSGEQYSSHGLAAGTSLTKKASKLTAAARNQISEGNFALPGRRYPIHDITHARSALSMVAAHGTPAEKTTVRKAVHAKFPSIGENK